MILLIYWERISFRRQSEIDGAFIYADPPYVGTNDGSCQDRINEEQSN